MIRFLHGDEEVAIEAVQADTTVLEYLRRDRACVGTKEGCASGDCGACTVVQVSPDDEGLCYEPINACIATLGGLHGKQLLCVENLAEDGQLHPVQEAMVACHGSQCGFCTPGFVMSLFALYHRKDDAEYAEIIEALGGNLCRCTGYKPIIAAAERALEHRDKDSFDHQRAASTRDRLRALADTQEDTIALARGESRYFRPATTQSLTALLREHEDARLLAGGTDLLLEVTQGLKTLDCLIDVRAVPDLATIDVNRDVIEIGAAVTHRQAQTTLLGDYPELAELIERFGSLQIRSQGTVVGNIANASPIGDWPPTFLALNASLVLESAQGRREIALDDFFLAYRKTALEPGEFIRSLKIPRRSGTLFLRAYKISKRFEDDISSVCGVFALHLDGDRILRARVAFGGMAAVPARALACEAALVGLSLRSDSLTACAAALDSAFQPISDARASATYRALVARRLLDRLQADFRGEATRVHTPAAAMQASAPAQ